MLYFVNAGLLLGCVLLAQFVRRSKLGRILVAMRDKEDRVRFSGYDVANFKIFVFCFAAGLAAIGGAMFTLQVGFMSPSFVGIVPSIEMVIFCAVGGRTSILGAIYGALTVNWARTTFSEDLPQVWLFAMGSLFILVVVAVSGRAGRHLPPVPRSAGSIACCPQAAARPPPLPPWKPRTRPHPREIAGAAMSSETDYLLSVEGLTSRSTASAPSTTCHSTWTATKSASSSAPTAPARRRCWI